jgi:uncharacterized membrane protein YeiH
MELPNHDATSPAAFFVALTLFGDVVFSVSGALAAGRKRMDIVGFVLIGTVTGIGGGTLRDVLLDRPVWWTQHPLELVVCVVASIATYFFVPQRFAHEAWLAWADALGLAAFAVVGCHTAMQAGVNVVVAIFMGVITATGGGVLRDTICRTPVLVANGELYASAAFAGAACYTVASGWIGMNALSQSVAFVVAFGVRAAAIAIGIQLGPPGSFLRRKQMKGTSDHLQ